MDSFRDDVDDFGRRAFHVEHDRIDAADEVIVTIKPSTVPNKPSSGASWAMVASKFNFSSSRGTSARPASSSASRTRSRPWSRFRMAVRTRRATGPGVASQIESASTTLLRLSTVRTPLRNSVELICAR